MGKWGRQNRNQAMTVFERITLLDRYYLDALAWKRDYSGSFRFMVLSARESRRRWKLYFDLRDSNDGLDDPAFTVAQ
jgi:hypothetical protein